VHAGGPRKRAFCWANPGEEEKQQPVLLICFFFFKNMNSDSFCLFQ
jgi:hypothetical protein